MFKKMIGSLTLACTIITSTQILIPAKRADALIIAAFTHNHHARHDYCLAGIICLFFIPPLGLILNADSLVADFDRQLPFLADTNEGMILKSELHQIANSLEVKKGSLRVRNKQYKKIKSEGKINSKKDLLSKVEIINHQGASAPQEEVKSSIALSRSYVESILDQGDYTESEKATAVATLCK